MGAIALLSMLLLVSLYFNIRYAKRLKEYSEKENHLIRNAYFNPITELPNRANIELVVNEHIARVLRHSEAFIVTVVKLKNYYDVKLRLGDTLSQEFVLQASKRLLDSIRDEDTVGHITEDGFVIVFNEYLSEDNYHIVTDRITAAFEAKPEIDTKYDINYEIGIGHTKFPDDGSDAKLLIDKATHNALK